MPKQPLPTPAAFAVHQVMTAAPHMGAPVVAGTPAYRIAPTDAAANVVPMPTKAPVDDGARINLSDIKDRIAPLSITAEGLAQLGFPHVAQEKASKLYRAADFPSMRDAMVKHLMSLDRQQAA